ncbi:hypothetical protein VC83_02070 [Pseudogymnoascus destructans]|uniref:Uncharacterized protein n=2 Tax=Pseudogymnoascus destructans TaxID=655981 RepID=L8FWP7_PSED2|nr:uncharacterized protein VC83_02070 [Pseudogymnoascus destructans]ELR04146.1 hypothetical protein GMDG_01450 [Pseudogymnoascus destructans 20631-21]OAF61620.1 hypothetical protein VC83_02070 [Pseudogymnoascus destructans]
METRGLGNVAPDEEKRRATSPVDTGATTKRQKKADRKATGGAAKLKKTEKKSTKPTPLNRRLTQAEIAARFKLMEAHVDVGLQHEENIEKKKQGDSMFTNHTDGRPHGRGTSLRGQVTEEGEHQRMVERHGNDMRTTSTTSPTNQSQDQQTYDVPGGTSTTVTAHGTGQGDQPVPVNAEQLCQTTTQGDRVGAPKVIQEGEQPISTTPGPVSRNDNHVPVDGEQNCEASAQGDRVSALKVVQEDEQLVTTTLAPVGQIGHHVSTAEDAPASMELSNITLSPKGKDFVTQDAANQPSAIQVVNQPSVANHATRDIRINVSEGGQSTPSDAEKVHNEQPSPIQTPVENLDKSTSRVVIPDHLENAGQRTSIPCVQCAALYSKVPNLQCWKGYHALKCIDCTTKGINCTIVPKRCLAQLKMLRDSATQVLQDTTNQAATNRLNTVQAQFDLMVCNPPEIMSNDVALHRSSIPSQTKIQRHDEIAMTETAAHIATKVSDSIDRTTIAVNGLRDDVKRIYNDQRATDKSKRDEDKAFQEAHLAQLRSMEEIIRTTNSALCTQMKGLCDAIRANREASPGS